MSHPPVVARHSLLPHPAVGPGPVRGISVALDWIADHLVLDFTLTGDPAQIQWPESRTPLRTDGLWRHTCFEVFIGRRAASDYWEYNFSPSGAWAAYHFRDYREGMAPLQKGAPPALAVHMKDDAYMIRAEVDLAWLRQSPAGAPLKVGVAAVIEDRAHLLSYWALGHPAEKPDFHHADSFVLSLD